MKCHLHVCTINCRIIFIYYRFASKLNNSQKENKSGNIGNKGRNAYELSKLSLTSTSGQNQQKEDQTTI